VPTPDGTLPAAWYRDVGSVGLPPEGATPSTPGPGVLVGQYTITSQPPFIGSAFLFADGRLIWNEHHTPVREGWWSTGWLEQRLTPEGLELAHELVTRTTAFPGPPAPPWMVLDPRALPSRLPPSAWADMTPRPYVPQRLAACLDFPESAATLTDVLSMLPTGARDLLDGRPLAVVPPTMESPPCLELRVADAHRLDSVLRNEGWDQDPRMNRLILEYHVAIEGEAPTWRLSVLFATVLPHGLVVMAIGG
jgi:hypothetical protein